MRNFFILALLLSTLAACKQDGPKASPEADSGDSMASEAPGPTASVENLPDLSLYHLPSTWTTQEGETLELDELRGQVLVMVMIYTSCQASCPQLVKDMKEIEQQVDADKLDKTKFILVSIDPETDTPERLKEFAKENNMEEDHWLFLRGTPKSTQEFAAILSVKYTRISPIDFSHSNIISIFNEDGVLVYQREGLGRDARVHEVLNEQL